MTKDDNSPIPNELLPGSSVEDDPTLWEDRVQHLMAAASPILAQYRTAPTPWWSVLAERLQPRLAVAAAAAAAIMVAVHLSLPARSSRAEPNLSLSALIADGNVSTALLPIADIETDPVLALVILEGETQ